MAKVMNEVAMVATQCKSREWGSKASDPTIYGSKRAAALSRSPRKDRNQAPYPAPLGQWEYTKGASLTSARWGSSRGGFSLGRIFGHNLNTG
jgi:hypothetical protein